MDMHVPCAQTKTVEQAKSFCNFARPFTDDHLFTLRVRHGSSLFSLTGPIIGKKRCHVFHSNRTLDILCTIGERHTECLHTKMGTYMIDERIFSESKCFSIDLGEI